MIVFMIVFKEVKCVLQHKKKEMCHIYEKMFKINIIIVSREAKCTQNPKRE